MFVNISDVGLPFAVMAAAVKQLESYSLNTTKMVLTSYGKTSETFWTLYFGGISVYVDLNSKD